MATGRGIGILRLLGVSRRERYGMERVGPPSSGGSHSPEITTVYVVPSLSAGHAVRAFTNLRAPSMGPSCDRPAGVNDPTPPPLRCR